MFLVVCFILRLTQHYLLSLMERKKSSIEDYKVTHILGKGSFGEVVAVKKSEGELMAMKKIRKELLSKANKLYQPYIQKEVLTKLLHPGVVKLYDTFADNQHIYFVMEICPNGDLEQLIEWGKLKQDTKRQLAAEILIVLQYLQSRKVVHRDFKSANVLIGSDGHIKLSDFGTAYAPESFLGTELFNKINQIKQINKEELMKMEEGARRATFVGTPLYMSPELLSEAICDYASDLWGFGCLLYEMYFGCPPFEDDDQYIIFKKIQETQVQIPKGVHVEEEISDIILKLLTKDRKKRLGCGQTKFQQIKDHPYFKNINWDNVFKDSLPFFNEISEWKHSKQAAKLKEKSTTYLITGVVGKKMLFGNWKDRQMALTAEPKLIYFDDETGEKKGQIDLDINTPIELDGNKFNITGKKKKYYFKAKKEEHGKSASEWVDAIKNAISGSAFSM